MIPVEPIEPSAPLLSSAITKSAPLTTSAALAALKAPGATVAEGPLLELTERAFVDRKNSDAAIGSAKSFQSLPRSNRGSESADTPYLVELLHSSGFLLVAYLHPRMDPYIQQRLRHYKTIGVERVKVQASGRSDECSRCKALDAVVYDLDKVPELPPRGCTCALGCGCIVTHVLIDDVVKLTVRDDDLKQPERPQVAPTPLSDFQADAPDLQDKAKESWTRFLSSARVMITSAGQLLRILGIWIAWFLARGAAHCIQFISTTFPAQAKHIWARAKFMIRQRGKSLVTWASVTLTARHPPT